MIKQSLVFSIRVLFLFGIVFTACSNSTDGGLEDLVKYEYVGASVARKEWTENYDCSNFSVQFYQNCYKAGLPCRVRFGEATAWGGGGHAYNSVKIDGRWLDWEPQYNFIYNGHTKRPEEKVSKERFEYELIGRTVPSSVIDNYEIDKNFSVFIPYFNGYCLSDDPAYNTLIGLLGWLSNLHSIYITNNNNILFVYKINDKYYGIEYSEETDPIEGRSVIKPNRLKYDFTEATEFIERDFIDLKLNMIK